MTTKTTTSRRRASTNKSGLLLLLFAAAVPLPLAACKDCGGGGSGATPSATTSASATPSTSVASSGSASGSASSANRRGPQVRASGATGAIFRATNALDLTPEQKTSLEKIGEDLKTAGPAGAGGDGGAPAMEGDAGGAAHGGRAEMKEAHADLVSGVKAGKLDMAKLDAHQATMDKAAKARLEKEAEALNKLHTTLNTEQRAKVVSNIKTLEEKRANRVKAHEKPDAGKPNFAKMRFEHYTRDLDLNDEQKKKVEGLIPKEDKTEAMREENKKVLETTLAAFEKDTFDAKKLPQPDPKKRMQPFTDLAKFFNGLVPILKPEQREKLASKLEKQPEDHGGRSHRGPRGVGSGGGRDHEMQEEDDEVD